jgi:cysteine sulfinate desulfinase/cysteine desulfurase-like protein
VLELNPKENKDIIMSLYKNIHKKRKRIKAGSGEKMRKPGTKGAPTASAFKKAAKTARRR